MLISIIFICCYACLLFPRHRLAKFYFRFSTYFLLQTIHFYPVLCKVIRLKLLSDQVIYSPLLFITIILYNKRHTLKVDIYMKGIWLLNCNYSSVMKKHNNNNINNKKIYIKLVEFAGNERLIRKKTKLTFEL